MSNKKEKEIILKFKGDLDYDRIGDLISTLKQKMKKRGVHVRLYKKLLTLMIESLENIVRYSSEIEFPDSFVKKYPPQIVIGYINRTYTFEVANLVRKSDIPELEKRLTQLNEMDQDSLKKLYKLTITDGKFSAKGGAGLGIIEMAKISDDKLDYTFHEITNELCVYDLTIRIHPNISISSS